jgi:hypothetical protein
VPEGPAGVAIEIEVTAVTYPVHAVPRAITDAAGTDAAGPADVPGAAAREHALALLAASPVYARVARLLGVDGADALAIGRSDIGARLAQLPAGWHVVNAPGLDHLVVGPGGVFAVCVQHRADAAVTVDGDAFKVNGRHQRCVGDVRRRSSRSAAALAAALGHPVPVRAVVAVSGAQRGFAVKQQPRDVTVVNRKTMTPFLHAQPLALDAAAVERVAAAAARLAGGR